MWSVSAWVTDAPTTRTAVRPVCPTAARSRRRRRISAPTRKSCSFRLPHISTRRTASGSCRFTGCIYEPEQDSRKRGVVAASIRQAAGVEAGSPEAQRLDQRVRLFLVDNERGKTISIRLGTRAVRSRHFRARWALPGGPAHPCDEHRRTAVTPRESRRVRDVFSRHARRPTRGHLRAACSWYLPRVVDHFRH